MEDYGLDDPILTGRRRMGVRHNSFNEFNEFIALGAPDDEWVFLIVPDVPGEHRPIDLISTLDMTTGDVADATCAQLSLTGYLQLLKDRLDFPLTNT